MSYLIVFFLSIVLNYFIRNFFIKKKLFDEMNYRSSHKTLATRSGGLVLFLVIFSYCTYLYFKGEQPFDFSILIPLAILFVTGLYDDIYKVDFGLKFIFQIIVVKYMIDIGYVIDVFSLFGLDLIFSRQVSQLVTIFIFVAIINAYNFIDGIDSNIHFETIKNLILILFFFQPNQTYVNLIIFTFIIVLVTLFFNIRKKGKVFMGDSGSLILPLLLIIFIFQSTYFGDQNTIKYLLVIFIYPLIDLIRVVLIRLRNNKSPFLPDTNHLHHLINNKTNSHLQSSLIITTFVLILQLALIFLIF